MVLDLIHLMGGEGWGVIISCGALQVLGYLRN